MLGRRARRLRRRLVLLDTDWQLDVMLICRRRIAQLDASA
jgi:hypothetical protein